MARLCLLLLLALLLGGCGQKGPLYFPAEQASLHGASSPAMTTSLTRGAAYA